MPRMRELWLIYERGQRVVQVRSTDILDGKTKCFVSGASTGLTCGPRR